MTTYFYETEYSLSPRAFMAESDIEAIKKQVGLDMVVRIFTEVAGQQLNIWERKEKFVSPNIAMDRK